MKAWISIITILAGGIPAIAQTVDASDYYPLAVGNEWTYFLPTPGADTLWDGTFGIDSLVVHDTLYFLARHPFSFSDTLRDDGGGRILTRLNGREHVLFDFTVEDGATYHFERSRSGYDTFVVTVSRARTADVGAGHFEDCVRFYFDVPGPLDDEHFWTFAPGVGIVEAGGFVGAYTQLFSAVVDGKLITSSAGNQLDGPGGLEGSAYPNPSRGGMRISVLRPWASDVTATLFDVTGRRVRELDAGNCSLGRCQFHVHQSDLPAAGTYFVVLMTDRESTTVPITVLP